MIAFERQEIVRSALLHDLVCGLRVGVECIEHDDMAIERSGLGQEFTRGRNFIGLFLHQHRAQGAPAFDAERADQLGFFFLLGVGSAAP